MSPNYNDGTRKWSLLNKLKRVVKKLNVILTSTYKFNQWRLASISILRGSSTRRYTRHLSFKDEMGLYNGCSNDVLMNEDSNEINKRDLSSFRSFGRMNNYNKNNYGVEDIDTRADLFIENFHRQLRMERQISLELRYCNYNNK
ncbi:uncharacterized protein [Spinacia oleracea]|uniref:Uncharacterized protein n=1 Tax=Spinacia oleracea TaxID=3562 RepID=A0ABM3R4B9_SPIOL|nr:uncharacterized protein LOC130465645 [Spinacia oleracea]